MICWVGWRTRLSPRVRRLFGPVINRRTEDNVAAGLEIAEVGRARNPPTEPRPRFGGAAAFGLVVWAAVVAGCANGRDPGTAWGEGSFDTNGERIYFTSTSDSGEDIDYEGGPGSGGMMMGGRLSCASCHGPDARGGRHRMHMDVMDAPNIRWVALSDEDHDDRVEDTHEQDAGYDVDAFRFAVMGGVHRDGEPLSNDMPRWTMSESDLQDLIEYLQTFDEP